MADFIKCKFCGYKVYRNYRTKSGKFFNNDKAYARLMDHVIVNHENLKEVKELMIEQEIDDCFDKVSL